MPTKIERLTSAELLPTGVTLTTEQQAALNGLTEDEVTALIDLKVRLQDLGVFELVPGFIF